MEYTCPVCGWPHLNREAYSGNAQPFYEGEPSYDYCTCCKFQFGVTDMDKGYTFQQWRKEWIAKGMPWYGHYTKPPINWNPAEQVAKVMHIEGGRW